MLIGKSLNHDLSKDIEDARKVIKKTKSILAFVKIKIYLQLAMDWNVPFFPVGDTINDINQALTHLIQKINTKVN